MKIRNFLLVFFLITSISLISCNKDSDSLGLDAGASIIGKWRLQKVRGKITYPPGSGYELSNFDSTYTTLAATLEFNQNGIVNTCTDTAGCKNGYYKISGDILNFSKTPDFTTESQNGTILTLSSKSLVIYYKFNDSHPAPTPTNPNQMQSYTNEAWNTWSRQ